jgi:hypothetical protein
MTPNRVTEKTYPNSQIPKEGITMTSRTRSAAFKALLVGLASLMLVFAGSVSTVLAEGQHHNVPGQPGHNGGIQFFTPFVIGVTGLLINKVTDCATGAVIPPEKLTAEFVFADGAQPPFQFGQLKKIILKAEGYQPKEITQFMTMQFGFGFLVLTFIIPLEGDICLQAIVCNNPQIVIQWGSGPGTPQFPAAGGGIVNMENLVGEERSFQVIADDSDPDKPAPRDYLESFSIDPTTPLPAGAVWLPEIGLPFAKSLSGTFRWTPLPRDARAEPYIVRFRTKDVCPGGAATVEARITVKTRLPNLVPVEVQSVKLGGPQPQWRVKFRVHNRGSVGAAATQVRIRGTRIGDGRVVEYSFGTGALEPFQTTGEIFGDFAGEDYDVEIFVDPENKVQEVDEGDNIVRLQLRS